MCSWIIVYVANSHPYTWTGISQQGISKWPVTLAESTTPSYLLDENIVKFYHMTA